MYFAERHDVVLLSNDYNLGVKAMVHGIRCFAWRSMPDDLLATVRAGPPPPRLRRAADMEAMDPAIPPPAQAGTAMLRADAYLAVAEAAQQTTTTYHDPLVSLADGADSAGIATGPRHSGNKPGSGAVAPIAPVPVPAPVATTLNIGLPALLDILVQYLAPAVERHLRHELGDVRAPV